MTAGRVSVDGGGDRPAGLSRREVLVLGSTAALVAAGGRWARGASFLLADRVTDLSVGYLEGSGDLADLGRPPWEGAGGGPGAASAAGSPIEVVPAGGLPLGDQSLVSRSLRLRVYGLYPDLPGVGEAVAGADLFVLFPSPDPQVPQPIPYLAWSFETRDGVDVAAPVEFPVPVGPEGTVTVALEVKGRVGHHAGALRPGRDGVGDGPSFGPLRRQTTFVVDWQDAAPKLQRGVYLLGLDGATWGAPAELPLPGEPPRGDLRSVGIAIDPVPDDGA